MRRAGLHVASAALAGLVILTAGACGDPVGPSAVRPTGAPAARGTASRQGAVLLMAVGDVLLGGSVGRRVAQFGPAYPFSGVAPLLRSADITFANLECPFTTREFALNKEFLFRAEPRLAPSLRSAGVGIVSLANNHAMDCGPAGLGDTMDALKAAGVRWCGAIRGGGSPAGPVFMTVNGLRVAFVALTEHGPVGEPTSRGPRMTRASEADVRRCVAAARRQADIVVVSFHWGIEVTPGPSVSQARLGQAAVAAGADLVLGHHPHVLQGMRLVRSPWRSDRMALIAYSLGNFVFGNAGILQSQTVVLRCVFGSSGLVSADVVPMETVSGRPRAATRAESKALLGRLSGLSARLGTRMVGTRVYGGPGR